MSTVCVSPWTVLCIGPDGRTSFCNATAPMTIDGRPASVYRDSLDQLWNGDDIVAVRAAMANGEKPSACNVCWEREQSGGVSHRQVMTSAYRALGGRLSVESLHREGAKDGFRLRRAPDWFILELGNVCNLRCRSCSPLFSSAIGADPVHSAWFENASAGGHAAVAPAPRRRLRLAPDDRRPWFNDVDRVADMIAPGADGNALLTLLGGEPFLIDATWRLLRALVERDVAEHLAVGVVTNGQQRRDELAELAPRFRRFDVTVSIDGTGQLYEYLRHGACWSTLVENVRWLRSLPGLHVSAAPALQNANLLEIVTLLRFFDEHSLPVISNVLSSPERLRPTNLPPPVRHIAAGRLRQYLDQECPAHNRQTVNGYVGVLAAAGDSFDAGLFAEFMTFTNDLDAARGESLRAAAPELWELLSLQP